MFNNLKVLLLLLMSMALVGCTALTPLYESKDHVSIYLAGEPEVERTHYKIRFVFETPTDDTHLIQTLDLGIWTGTEAFRTQYFVDETGIDSHWIDSPDAPHDSSQWYIDNRTITIRPGEVVDVDENCGGFSMLPGGWPDNFNKSFRESHSVQGRIEYERSEHATTYQINFVNGVLRFNVVGTSVSYQWKVQNSVD